MSPAALPIDSCLEEITRTVMRNPITLLAAEPGAGKTTRVPPALLANGLEPVYVLEPRRVAARLAARRVASERGEELGQSVGYRVRFEAATSNQTRLFYCTEGVLVRMLLSAHSFRAGAVVLDEFHERHLETDLALALLRKLHPRIPLLIMSATLDVHGLAAALDSPPVIQAPGRAFPISIEYTPHSAVALEDQVAEAAAKAVENGSGHTLIFLPGAAEIRRSLRSCEALARRANLDLYALHGDLPSAEQDRALAPSMRRKLICSTNIAETSVTMEGVGAVIDSGLVRVQTHSAWSGFRQIAIRKISRSSAIQRAGRAGRTGPGFVIRLYSEAEFVRFSEQLLPEILRSELSETVLLLAARGLLIEDLCWLDAPPPATMQDARKLLSRLRALHDDGSITAFGERMAALPLHPRLASFVLHAAAMGARETGCDLAARFAEARRLETSDLDGVLATPLTSSAARLRARLLQQVAEPAHPTPDPDALEKALLLAYPDRVARRRADTLLLGNGGSARLDRGRPVQSEFLLAIDADQRDANAPPLVRFAVPIKPDWLLDLFPERIRTREELTWNRERNRVEQVSAMLYDNLAIDQSSGPHSDIQAASELLARKAVDAGLASFGNTRDLERLLARARFAAQHASIEVPAKAVEQALSSLANGLSSFDELRTAIASGALVAMVEARLPMQLIDELAPRMIQLPSGRRTAIEYHEDGKPPSIASRLQDFFGLSETPRIARGAVPLTIQLLAPNRRPVQVTTDLANFWRTLYPKLRRELGRRYPKHAWPEMPL